MDTLESFPINVLKKGAWAPLTVFVFYAIAAKLFNAYITYPWLDMPTHFLGGMAITFFYLVAIFHAQDFVGQIPRSFRIISALGLTALTAIFWEFAEYCSDYFLHSKVNLGVLDTLSDLFFGLFGGAVTLAVSVASRRG